MDNSFAENDDAQKSAVLEQESDTVQRGIYAGDPTHRRTQRALYRKCR